jgi:hypothetical protein
MGLYLRISVNGGCVTTLPQHLLLYSSLSSSSYPTLPFFSLSSLSPFPHLHFLETRGEKTREKKKRTRKEWEEVEKRRGKEKDENKERREGKGWRRMC